MPADKPVKVTLFDEDYAVVRGRERDNDKPIALVDKCPHRLAALSEGRAVFTSVSSSSASASDDDDDESIRSEGTATIRVQCAYHGWTFEGTSVGRGQADGTVNVMVIYVGSAAGSSYVILKRLCNEKVVPFFYYLTTPKTCDVSDCL